MALRFLGRVGVEYYVDDTVTPNVTATRPSQQFRAGTMVVKEEIPEVPAVAPSPSDPDGTAAIPASTRGVILRPRHIGTIVVPEEGEWHNEDALMVKYAGRFEKVV